MYFNCNYLIKAPSSKTITWGIKLQHVTLREGDTHIHFITEGKCKIPGPTQGGNMMKPTTLNKDHKRLPPQVR